MYIIKPIATENPTRQTTIISGYVMYHTFIHLKTSSYIKKINKAQNHLGTPPDSFACFINMILQ